MPSKKDVDKVIEAFTDFATRGIDEKGIFPLPMVAIPKDRQDGEGNESAADADGRPGLGEGRGER